MKRLNIEDLPSDSSASTTISNTKSEPTIVQNHLSDKKVDGTEKIDAVEVIFKIQNGSEGSFVKEYTFCRSLLKKDKLHSFMFKLEKPPL